MSLRRCIPGLTWINRLLFMVSRARARARSPDCWDFRSSISPAGSSSNATVARSRPGQTEAAKRLHAILQQLQRYMGPVYRCFFRRHSGRSRSALVFQHKISAFDTDHAVQELYQGKPDRHRLLLQFGARGSPARRQGGDTRSEGYSRRLPGHACCVVSRGVPKPATYPRWSAVQNDLGYQGFAPVASNDTQNADKNR